MTLFLLSVRRGDVLSAWSGIRPLVVDPNKKSTQEIARNHIIHISDSKMVTIAGMYQPSRLFDQEEDLPKIQKKRNFLFITCSGSGRCQATATEIENYIFLLEPFVQQTDNGFLI
jgi:hypothetical protein